MTIHFSSLAAMTQSRLTAAAITVLLLTNSCKNNKPEDAAQPDAAITVETLHQNNIGQASNMSSFLLSQAHSPVHWQPWSKEVFAHAASEKKTVFAFIGSGTDSYSIEILKKINASPATYTTLNNSHVNVLIDANQHPDLAFFIASLGINSGNAISATQLAWFSHEGIPISWVSISSNSQLNVHELMIRMSATVEHLWLRDPDYVLENSRGDLARRLKILTPKPAEKDDPIATIRASRQAGSMFDPTSNNIDNMSGLSVARFTELMALAAAHPDASTQQSKNYINIAKRTADNILLRGLIDPLDGGIFSGIQRSTSALPVFTKTLSSQTRSMEALYRLYRITNDKNHLVAAESIRNYIETNLILPDGGHALGIIYGRHGFQDNSCIWTLEEIEAALSQEETKLCTLAFGISGLGNIPLVDDQNRSYFRKNTLTWKTSVEELATITNMAPEDLRAKLKSITKKLIKLRIEKTANRKDSKLATAETTAALASAYVTAYRITGDSANLDKAKRALDFIRTQFTDQSGKLQRCRFNGKLLAIPAKGIDYARTCSAALDMHEATLDPTWLEWAAQLHQEMTSALATADLTDLTETDGSGYPYPFQIRQFITIKPLDNSSTWAISYSNAARLHIRLADDSLTKQADHLKMCILKTTDVAPLSNIDFLSADTRLSQKTVYLKAPATPKLIKAALPHACQLVLVTEKGVYPELGNAASSLTASNAVVIQRGKTIGTADDAQGLIDLLR